MNQSRQEYRTMLLYRINDEVFIGPELMWAELLQSISGSDLAIKHWSVGVGDLNKERPMLYLSDTPILGRKRRAPGATK